MTKQISFNAFEMNCIAHQSPGLWRHPKDRSTEYKALEYWTDLAKILEKGCFDGIFIADVLGFMMCIIIVPNMHSKVPYKYRLMIRYRLCQAMAAVTQDLGFGLTTSISFEHPYPFARRISTRII